MSNFLEIRQEALSKKEVTEQVVNWCEDDNAPDIAKWVFLKQLEMAVEIGKEKLKKSAKESYLQITEGAIEKKNLFGVEITTQSTVKKQTLAKQYIFSDEVDAMETEIEKLRQQLKDKEDLLKARKVMEINGGIATELTGGGEIGEDTSTPENDFNLVIKFRKE